MARPDVKLLMVTDDNHNKFYNLHDNGNGTFTAHWGRVGAAGQQKVYSIYEWDDKYYSKLNKGYEDVTANYGKVSSTYAPCTDSEINNILNKFLENSRQYVSYFTDTQMISDTAAAEAQRYINLMAKNIDEVDPDQYTLNEFRRYQLKLFEIIPRKMSKVQESLCQSLRDRPNVVQREQSLLDNMVNLTQNAPKANNANQTIEDAFGFTLEKCTPAEVDMIKDKLNKDGFNSGRFTFSRVFKIITPQREAAFQDYLDNNNLKNNKTNVKMYYHGTGTENILSILSNGLLIKPSNATHTGSMFGEGIYTAPSVDKASGYTSISGSYWKGGSSNFGYLFITAVIMGKQYDVSDNYETYGGIKIYNLDGDKFSSANLGYHSVYAHKGSSLRRDECIVYNSAQCACRYLVEYQI